MWNCSQLLKYQLLKFSLGFVYLVGLRLQACTFLLKHPLLGTCRCCIQFQAHGISIYSVGLWHFILQTLEHGARLNIKYWLFNSVDINFGLRLTSMQHKRQNYKDNLAVEKKSLAFFPSTFNQWSWCRIKNSVQYENRTKKVRKSLINNM